MARVLAVLFAAIAASAGPVSAQIIVQPRTVQALLLCEADRIFAPGDSGAPPVIARSFEGRGKVVTFRTCRDADGNTHYFIRKPRPNRDGVCRVVEDELFPGTPKDFVIVDLLYDGTAAGWYFDLHGWTFRPPGDWHALNYGARHKMLALVTSATAPCPRTDDVHYIPVSATDGMLKTFFGVWRSAKASPDSFDKIFAAVPVLPIPMFERLGTVRTLPGLKRAIFESHEDIASIDCEVSGLGTASGCTAWVDLFSITFDVTDRGLAITGVWENPLI